MSHLIKISLGSLLSSMIPALPTRAQVPSPSVLDSLREGLSTAVTRVMEFLPNLLVAVAILVLGWIIAKVIAFLVGRAIGALKIGERLREGEAVSWVDVSNFAQRLTYWLVMLFVLMGFFWSLQLEIITGPINRLLEQVFGYVPQLIGAGFVLLVSWVVALLLRTVVTQALRATGMDERLSKRLGETEKQTSSQRVKPLGSETLGQVVFWIVLLVGLLAALNTLQLQAITVPLQNMLTRFLEFVPNLVGAGIILLIGLFFARLIRDITRNILTTTGLDGWADRVGVTRAFAGRSASQLVGLLVYILIVIPVLIAVLGILEIQALSDPAVGMLESVLAAIPLLFAAAVILVIAYALAKVLADLSSNLLAGVGFDAIPERLGLRKEQLHAEARTPSQMAGKLVLVGLMLVALMEASRMIGFTALASLTQELIVFGANVLFAFVILGLGLYFAQLARDLILSAFGEERGRIPGGIARYGIIVFAVALALPRLGVPSDIVALAFGIPLLAVAIALAIAFGIGGRELAARQLDSWFKRG